MTNQSKVQADEKIVLIMRCADCGEELNRTGPLTQEQAARARILSAFAGGKCPKGCRSTFSNLNINTVIDEAIA